MLSETKKIMKYIVFLIIAFTSSVTYARKIKAITVTNPSSFPRHEVVTVSLGLLKELGDVNTSFLVREKKSQKVVLSQSIDWNTDNTMDELVFEVELNAKEKKEYAIEAKNKNLNLEVDPRTTFSRLVPERIDDYAWENDLVAFRTYGPEAQRLVDENLKGGTLSSGLDCWLKRVNYPVIDKWYRKYVDGGTYHKDDGEGYDPYHVGASRGCGGIGVWKNDSLYVSKNFVSYKRIASGPVRTVFELTYAPWKVDEVVVNETKRITLDLGSQLYKVEDITSTSGTIPNITIGITLHEKKGTVSMNAKKGWFSYWETIDDAPLGTGVVVDPGSILDHADYRTLKKDLSQIYIMTKPEKKVTYYTGFGWSKAGVITSREAWNDYLDRFAQQLSVPLQVSVK
jgi:hypothetical protein